MNVWTYSLRTSFVTFTILLLATCIFGKHAIERYVAEQEYVQIENSLSEAIRLIESGKISTGMHVRDYTNLVTPVDRIEFGAFAEFRHGFIGGLGHGVTIISKNDRLVKAYSWSCCGGDSFFNTMTSAEEKTYYLQRELLEN
jgi:hypothetical protein